MKKVILALLMVLPLSVSAQKFGHFNSSDIMQAMPETTAARTELETKAKTYEEELKRMQDELKAKSDDYEANKATLIEDVKKRREQELNDLGQRFQEYYQKSQQDLEQIQNQKLTEIQQKVIKAVEEIGQAGGYVYIMDVTAGMPTFVNTSISTDLTSQIKAKLGIK